jgi:hypothetical protein
MKRREFLTGTGLIIGAMIIAPEIIIKQPPPRIPVMDFEKEMIELMSQSIAKEIDDEILKSLNFNPFRGEYHEMG